MCAIAVAPHRRCEEKNIYTCKHIYLLAEHVHAHAEGSPAGTWDGFEQDGAGQRRGGCASPEAVAVERAGSMRRAGGLSPDGVLLLLAAGPPMRIISFRNDTCLHIS